MSGNNVGLWRPAGQSVVTDSLSDPTKIASHALQLRDRERGQVAANFEAGNYEVAASYVWMRAMALLKKQLSTLGMEFIGELLQRPDIDEFSDSRTAISDTEAISLARDLGIITSLQTKRLLHSQTIVSHFASIENGPNEDPDEIMTREEAISCLRVCVQGVLGHEQISVAEDFKLFRRKLESSTLTEESIEIIKLSSSPYFFVRTAISILLSLFRTAKGAQIEHAARNALLIIPKFWSQLKDPERWQVGQAYAVEFNEGRKDSVKGLHAVLLKVAGFDYVPENLRSNTFIQAASSVIAAHQGMNNFYNEPAPMRELASLGTSIPGPALATCMTAILCVKLGNYYGTSWAAQAPADQLIKNLSKDRWYYYINGRLEQDRIILAKLTDEKPLSNWISLINNQNIDATQITGKDARLLIKTTETADKEKIRSIASRLFSASIG